MKKIIALLLATCLVFALCACGSTAPAAAPAPAATPAASSDSSSAPAPAPEVQKFTVGICQLVQHPALDSATQGFIDALSEELGDAVEFDNQNASGDIPTCATICNGFVSSKVDLILANATPALQAAAAATDSIPVLGTSITEYGVALELSDFNGTVGGNVSGTSDLAPLDQQAQMIIDLFPAAKTVAILYCSAEANSVYQADVVEAYLEGKGLSVERFTFADSNDVAIVTQTACGEADVLYIPTDNVAASCAEAIGNVAEPADIPIITGEVNVCKVCGVATLSIDYYNLGLTTGKMAAKILKGEANVAEMPIEYFENPVKMFNEELAAKYGVDIPSDFVAIED
ncbi:MAG: ABC transporter substrate-binding protein [Oscillospiraceae bacterium]|nr:ABC transporter substrate-binding protein [Oscillospiraceae bacterium]